MLVYLDYDQAELDKQYDPRAWAPDAEAEIDEARRLAEETRARLKGTFDIAYGDGPDEMLDVFPAAGQAGPVRVHFHGGGWLRGRKEGACAGAAMHVDAGAAFVAVNFSKLDAVSLDDIVRQSRAAVAWVYNNIADFGADPDQLFVSGVSSGGQQAAMVVSTDWRERGLPANTVKGAAIASASYDLEPLARTWRNDHMKLDADGVQRLSPIHHLPASDVDLVLAVAEHDSAEIHRQMDNYGDAWAAAGKPVKRMEIAGATHFTMTLELCDPTGPLGAAQLKQMGLA
jgi:arylformamidase